MPERTKCPKCSSPDCHEWVDKQIFDPGMASMRQLPGVPRVPPDLIGAYVHWRCDACKGYGHGRVAYVGPPSRPQIFYWHVENSATRR